MAVSVDTYQVDILKDRDKKQHVEKWKGHDEPESFVKERYSLVIDSFNTRLKWDFIIAAGSNYPNLEELTQDFSFRGMYRAVIEAGDDMEKHFVKVKDLLSEFTFRDGKWRLTEHELENRRELKALYERAHPGEQFELF